MGQVKGVLHKIYDEKQLTEKFKKREFVVYIPEQGFREKYVKFSLIQKDCSKIDDFQEGDTVSVSYSLEGRDWKNPKTNEVEYFNDIRANRISKEEEEIQMNDITGEGDDLPF